MRLFIGIKLDSNAQKKINNYFKFFYENKVTGNYTKITNLHMTLVFLGEVNDDKVPLIKDIIKSVNLEINEISIFKIKMMRDILIGEVENSDVLTQLYDNLVKKLKQHGFMVDDHALYPHVTLVRKAGNVEKCVGMKTSITSNFSRITLFESKRINNDLIYVDLGE